MLNDEGGQGRGQVQWGRGSSASGTEMVGLGTLQIRYSYDVYPSLSIGAGFGVIGREGDSAEPGGSGTP